MSSFGKVTAEPLEAEEEDIIPDSSPAVEVVKGSMKAAQPTTRTGSADAPKVSVRDLISKVNAKVTVPPSTVKPVTGTRSKPSSRATTPTSDPDPKSSTSTGATTSAVGDRPQPTSSPTTLGRKQAAGADTSSKGTSTSPSGKRPVSGRQLSPDKIAPFLKAGTAPTPASSSKSTTTASALPKLSADDVKPAATDSSKDVKPATTSGKTASTGYSFPGFSYLQRAVSGRSIATPAAATTNTTSSKTTPVTTPTAASTTAVTPTTTKVETKVETKPDVKPEVKAEVKVEVKAEVKTEVKTETKTDTPSKAEKIEAKTAKVEEAIYDSNRPVSTVGSKVSELAGRFQTNTTPSAQPNRLSLSRPKRSDASATATTPPAPATSEKVEAATSTTPTTASTVAPATTTTTSTAAATPAPAAAPAATAASVPVKSAGLSWMKKSEPTPSTAPVSATVPASSSAAPVKTTTSAPTAASTTAVPVKAAVSASASTTSSTSATPAMSAAKPVGKLGAASWMKKEEPASAPTPVTAAVTAKPAEKEATSEMGEKKLSIADRMKQMGGASMIPFGVKAPTKVTPSVAKPVEIIPSALDGGISESLLNKYTSKMDDDQKDGEIRHKTSSRASIRLGARRQPTKRTMSINEEEARAFSLVEDASIEADMAAARAMVSEDDI